MLHVGIALVLLLFFPFSRTRYLISFFFYFSPFSVSFAHSIRIRRYCRKSVESHGSLESLRSGPLFPLHQPPLIYSLPHRPTVCAIFIVGRVSTAVTATAAKSATSRRRRRPAPACRVRPACAPAHPPLPVVPAHVAAVARRATLANSVSRRVHSGQDIPHDRMFHAHQTTSDPAIRVLVDTLYNTFLRFPLPATNIRHL